MAILHSNGIMTVSSIPTHTPVLGQARVCVLKDTLTFYYYNDNTTSWQTVPADLVVTALQSVTGTNVDNTDPLNPVVNLQSATQTAVTDTGSNYTGTNVETILAEIATKFSGLVHTAITDINLIATANANEYSVEITWTDEDGNINTTTDATPVVIAGLGTAVQTVTDSNSIDFTKTGTDIKADLKLSATQTGATVTIESDGLRIVVDDETEPTGYVSKTVATAALGAGKKFQYLAANLDGAVEGTVAWT